MKVKNRPISNAHRSSKKALKPEKEASVKNLRSGPGKRGFCIRETPFQPSSNTGHMEISERETEMDLPVCLQRLEHQDKKRREGLD